MKLSPISKFTSYFMKNFRITILFIVALSALGFLSYTSFLKREGFPAVQFPFVIVQAPYFVNDTQQVNDSITEPVENAIRNVKEVTKIQSSTEANFAYFVVQFEESLTSEQGSEKVKSEIEKAVVLPEGASLNYNTINVASVDGKNDLVFSLVADKPVTELEAKAAEIADKLSENKDLREVEVTHLITKQVDPFTGKEFDYQATFNRVGIKKDGIIKFSPAINIGVIKKGDIETIDLSDSVKASIDELKEDGLLDGYEVTYGGDIAPILKSQLGSLQENAISAIIVVLIVLFILVNWRASIVTALFIPISMFATFLVLYALGYTLNVISLFGLVLVLGLFVDDGIVVVEAIDYQKHKGEKGLNAVLKAIASIGNADVMGTLTTVLVFVPMLFISGVLGKFIREIPVTVISALLLSIVIALSILPFLTNILISDKKEKKQKTSSLSRVGNIIFYGGTSVVRYLANKVSLFVNWYMKRPVAIAGVAIITVIMIIIGGIFASMLKFNIFPASKDGDQIAVSIQYDPAAQLEERTAIAEEVENLLVDTSNLYIEQVDYFNDSNSPQSAYMSITLTPMDTRSKSATDIVDDLKSVFANYDKARVKASAVSVGPPETDYQFMMQIYNPDTKTLTDATTDLAVFVKDITLDNDISVKEVKVDYLDNITKLDGRRYAEVKAKLSDPQNTGAVLSIIEKVKAEYTDDKLSQYNLNTNDIDFDLGQESENLDSFTSLIFAGLLSLILMYGLLVYQFNSFTQPLLIFLAIPLGFPGVFTGLYLTDNPMSFFVLVGMIGLIGIVVNNTIMLVDFANQARKEGKGIREAIVQAVRIRFRPLITTSIVTIVSLTPLALTDPFWESLALTIVFGLMSSTTLVILGFPAFYAIAEKLRITSHGLYRKVISIAA